MTNTDKKKPLTPRQQKKVEAARQQERMQKKFQAFFRDLFSNKDSKKRTVKQPKSDPASVEASAASQNKDAIMEEELPMHRPPPRTLVVASADDVPNAAWLHHLSPQHEATICLRRFCGKELLESSRFFLRASDRESWPVVMTPQKRTEFERERLDIAAQDGHVSIDDVQFWQGREVWQFSSDVEGQHGQHEQQRRSWLRFHPLLAYILERQPLAQTLCVPPMDTIVQRKWATHIVIDTKQFQHRIELHKHLMHTLRVGSGSIADASKAVLVSKLKRTCQLQKLL